MKKNQTSLSPRIPVSVLVIPLHIVIGISLHLGRILDLLRFRRQFRDEDLRGRHVRQRHCVLWLDVDLIRREYNFRTGEVSLVDLRMNGPLKAFIRGRHLLVFLRQRVIQVTSIAIVTDGLRRRVSLTDGQRSAQVHIAITALHGRYDGRHYHRVPIAAICEVVKRRRISIERRQIIYRIFPSAERKVPLL
jgi:hypothetical protein